MTETSVTSPIDLVEMGSRQEPSVGFLIGNFGDELTRNFSATLKMSPEKEGETALASVSHRTENPGEVGLFVSITELDANRFKARNG